MATSTMAEALAASLPAPQPVAAASTVPAAESIPPSMSKLIDIEAEIPLVNVQLDGLVVAKIIKHCQEARAHQATGLLLGIDLDGTLEISNCFPLPTISTRSSDNDDDKTARPTTRYQGLMLRSLKDIQRDDNVVGFYQTSTLGGMMTPQLVEMQSAQGGKLRHGGVVIVHDTSQSGKGKAEFRAFRLTSNFKQAHSTGLFSSQQLRENGLTFSNILEELPVVVRNSTLLDCYLSGLCGGGKEAVLKERYWGLEVKGVEEQERNLEELVEKMDEYRSEEANVAFVLRQNGREKARADAYVAKRKEENATRVGQGLAPLPEEDISRLFKVGHEPSRLDSLLVLGQIEGLAETLGRESGESLLHSFAVRG